jgi:hypothetical protein
MPHWLFVQVADPFAVVGHCVVQPPQWFGSFVRSAHVLLQLVSLVAQPLEHE